MTITYPKKVVLCSISISSVTIRNCIIMYIYLYISREMSYDNDFLNTSLYSNVQPLGKQALVFVCIHICMYVIPTYIHTM